jgi:hypothetical protein
MKRFVYLTVVLMIGFMLIGCAAVLPEQTAEHRKEAESWDLNSSVGNKPFVGETSPEARSLSRWTQMSGF